MIAAARLPGGNCQPLRVRIFSRKLVLGTRTPCSRPSSPLIHGRPWPVASPLDLSVLVWSERSLLSRHQGSWEKQEGSLGFIEIGERKS